MLLVVALFFLVLAWAASGCKDKVYRYNPATGRFEEDKRR
jgi:hypothetical protein